MKLDDLKARLRSSAKAFRENTVYDSEGDPLRLIVQADECDEAAQAITDLEALVGELGEALAECADDLEAEVRDRWFMGGTEVHPALEHKFERDMAPVNKARATLAKLEKARG